MNRNEYLYKLYYESGFMLSAERREMLNYFRSYFIPGVDETLICKRLGDPKTALKTYLEKRVQTNERGVARVVKGVAWFLLIPAIVDEAIIVAAAVSALFIFVMSLFIAAPIAAAGLWMGGIKNAISAIIDGGGAGAILSGIGGGLVMSGIGLLLIVGICRLYKKIIPSLIRETAVAGKKTAKFLKKQKDKLYDFLRIAK